jgi:hypothetical protein
MAMSRVRVRQSNYLPASKEVVGKNSYAYPYPQVKICTRTYTHVHQVSSGYRVPVGFVISHVKIISK